MNQSAYESKLDQLTKNYLEGLPKQIASITTAWSHLQHINWDKKALTVMALGSHKLVGSGETFRFPAISSAARALEVQLKQLLTQEDAQPLQRQQIDELLKQLKVVVEKAITSSHLPPTATIEPILTRNSATYNIAIIEDDKHQAEYLQAALQQQGYQSSIFTCPETFSTTQSEDRFDLILLDIGFPKGPLEGINWLTKLRENIGTKIPVIVISARADIVAKMQALRAGAEAYLSKPVNLSQLQEKIEHIREKAVEHQARVLWVDDDSDLLAAYENLLENAGYQVECTNQPLKLLERIENFRPDVVVLDYHMPKYNGIELAKLLRQDSRFMAIPIIFVSAADDVEKHEAFSIVGDAFLTKPLHNDEFLRCLKQQIAKAELVSSRIKQVSQRVEKHSLQNQSFFLAELETILATTDLTLDKETYYLVQATVDQEGYLKQTFGLRPMAKLTEGIERFLALHPNINGSGCILGGASFLLLLRAPRDGVDGDTLLQDFQKSLQAQQWTISNDSRPVTLSLGALALNQPSSLDIALRRVEETCAEAIGKGGNSIAWYKAEEQAVSSNKMEDKIKPLLREKAFKLFFQPIVNLQTGDTLFEALIRLEGDDKIIYPPSQFLPWIDKELEGGIYAFDCWVIQHAMQALSMHRESAEAEGSIIIKLSSSLAQITRLLPFIQEMLKSEKIYDTDKVIFAIPESIALNDVPQTTHIIESLNSLGCAFMLEHVGSSQYSAQLLNDLPEIDFIKLSTDVGTKTGESNNLKSLISQIKEHLAKDLEVVASGIEDAQMLSVFWDNGIRYFQGYFIQKPSDAMAYNSQ